MARFLHGPDRFDGPLGPCIERDKTCWALMDMTLLRSRYARRSLTRVAIALNGSLLALMYLYAFVVSGHG